MNSAACGLTWTPDWASPGEGAYTLLAKMSIANPLPLKTLQGILMGTRSETGENAHGHQRTLLSNGWMIAARADERCDWSHALTQATLDSVLDDWTHRLASDQALRYCPSCLAQGFHSPLCQIDGLRVCPVHGDALRNTCCHCEAPMPRFAWGRTFNDVGCAMHCKRCRQPFAHAWALASHLKWRAMPGAELYGALALKLAASREVQWLNSVAWDAALDGIDRSKRRCYEYALLQGALEPAQSAGTRVDGAYIEEWLQLPRVKEIDLFEGVSAQAPIGRAYEQAWRQISRAANAGTTQTWAESRSGVLEPDDFRDPESVAAYLFQCRFERARNPSSPPCGLRTRDFRPGVDLLAAFFDLDLDLWQHVFAACHRAELRFARLMRDRTAAMSRGAPGWAETLAFHECGLSRARPLPLGAALLSARHGDALSGILAFPRLPAAEEFPSPSGRRPPRD